MPVNIMINYDGFAALMAERNLTVRGARLLQRHAMRDVGEYWHRHLLPRHFRVDAKKKYKHQPRKKPYSKIKRLLAEGKTITINGETINDKVIKGGRADIVRSGKAERRAKRGRVIRAGIKTCTVAVRVPSYVAMRRRGPYPDMRNELLQTTAGEVSAMRDVYASSFDRNLREIRAHVTRLV